MLQCRVKLCRQLQQGRLYGNLADAFRPCITAARQRKRI